MSEELRGKCAPGSGNQWHTKGDVKTDAFVISAKRTDKDSYRLTKDDWAEALEMSFSENRPPAMQIEINGLRLFVISAEMFQDLHDYVTKDKSWPSLQGY